MSNRLPPSEHCDRVRRVRRPRLRHVPMLHNARPIHAIDIRQRNRLRHLINPHMYQPDIIIEIVS